MRKKFRRCKLVLYLVLGVLSSEGFNISWAVTNTLNFTYTNRADLLANGWSFLATSALGQPRDTETAVGSFPPDVSYDQVAHLGVLQIPVSNGDMWANGNNTANSLFRNLSSNWVSVQLNLTMTPVENYQQVHLALYQDDDNYVEIGHGYNGSVGGEGVLFVIENGGVQLTSPRIINRVAVVNTNVYLRLDRNLTNDFVTGFYSHNGTNWVSLGEVSQEFVNPRLCIWAGGSTSVNPLVCNLRRLDIVVSDLPLKPILCAEPRQLLFNAVAGEACTNSQVLRIISRRALSPLNWTLTTNAPWLSVGSVVGSTPAVSDVFVDTTGLSPGIYQATLSCGDSNAVTTTANVTLIVNPATRVRAATWRGGASGAMTVSVDDSQQSGFQKLRANGLVGSYMLWGRDAYSPFAAFYSAGMELGSHTVNHPCAAVDEPTRRYELEANLAGIVGGTGVPQAEIISFAWPCGFTTIKDQVIAADYFLSARGYNFNELETASPRNWMNLKNFNSHENDPHEFNPAAPNNPVDLKAMADLAEAQGKWFNLVLHTLTNDDDAIPYSREKDLWVAPLGSVVKYIQLRDRTIFTNYLETATNLSFGLFRLPLTASRLRSFEMAVHSNDLVTIQLDITGLPSVGDLAVAGTSTAYRVCDVAGRRWLYSDVLVPTNYTTVTLVVSNGSPIAVGQRITVAEDTATNLVLFGTGLAGHTLTYDIVSFPTNGNLTGTAPNLTYLATTNFHGADGFTFRVTDTVSGLMATGLVRLAVTNVNDIPLVQNPLSGLQADYATPFLAYATNVFFDADNEQLTYSAIGLPPGISINAAGTISGVPSQVGQFAVQLLGRDSRIPLLWVTNASTFIINKSNAPITFSNLNQVYTGTARTVSATTQPAGLVVNLLYDGGTVAPTNVGSYEVTAAVSDPNYTGSRKDSLIVAPAPALVNLTNLSQWFNGTPRIVGVVTEPSGLAVHLTYGGSTTAPIAAGDYEVIGKVQETNYVGAVTNTLNVSELPLIITDVGLAGVTNVTVTWQSIPSFTYQLQYKDQLDGQEWQPVLPTITATAASVTATNPVGANKQRFYRVLLVP